MKKLALSAFIVLNLATIAYHNLPADPARSQRRADPGVLRLIGQLDELYGTMTGLGNRWELFSELPHEVLRFTIEAEDAGGATAVLPLPGQGERTFWERNFFDFKEAKLRSNLLTDRDKRRAFADHLARVHPTRDGAPIRAVLWQVEVQPILPPFEAARAGTHLSSQVTRGVFDRLECRAPGAGGAP